VERVEGGSLDPKITALVVADESADFATSPRYATFGRGTRLTLPTLLLTNRRLLICKDRLFKPRIDFEVDWSDVSSVEGELWGDGKSIQLVVRDTNGSELVELIVFNQYAVEVESAIRSAYMKARDTL
jgi:hypothetical protein